MHPARFQRSEMRFLGIMICLFIALFFFSNCGGGSGGSDNKGDGNKDIINNHASTWHQVSIEQIPTSGLLLPQVKAAVDSNKQLHIAYFTNSLTIPDNYTVNHILWDMGTQGEISRDTVIDIDNCRTLGMVLGQGSLAAIAYQGGTVRAGGSEQQSDAMVSVLQGGSWAEYTGGIGFVERNPVFQDGLAGKYVSVALDSHNNIHLCYQFFYEGIDAMNFNYPDLLYVEKDGSSLGTEATEETVEGNVYNPDGSASEQNRVGSHAFLLLDKNENPVIFYYADLKPNLSDPDTKGLRVAYRQGDGTWQHEWVETGFEVGDISAALDKNGNPCVAYYIAGEYQDASGITHKECLKYAAKTSTSWTSTLVDESTFCGKYCSLAFNSSGNPEIAYYSMQNNSGSLTLKDLMLASKSGASWQKETVASTGDIGNYNTLWFDDAGTAYICSYSNSDQTIYLFYR
jgi:hypothetical protein